MDEVELVRAVRPAVTEPSSRDRSTARAGLDRAVGAGTGRKILGSRISQLAVAAGVVAFLLVAGTLWPSPRDDGTPLDSAVAIVFPDGSELTRGEVSRYVAEGRTEELRARLAEYNVSFVVEEQIVHPDADGRVFGWMFAPHDGAGMPPEFDANWYIDERDAGSTLTVQIGRAPTADEPPSQEGRTLFEVFPELCDAIVLDDFAATQANIESLGLKVKWWILDGHPDDPDYSGDFTTKLVPPNEGRIYGVMTGSGSGYATPDTEGVGIEIVPEDSDSKDRPHGAGKASSSYC